MPRHTRHQKTFAGYPVIDWEIGAQPPDDPTNVAIAIRVEWDEGEKNKDAWKDKFANLIEQDFVAHIPAFVVGMWYYDRSVKHVVEALAYHHNRLPNLRALFVGDIEQEEHEISWIRQDDLSPLWTAFPDLEYLVIRGGDGLKLGTLNLPHLKTLKIETGGLSGQVIRSVAQATLPELETLILWLGIPDYGGNYTIADFEGFYECAGMPRLKYLGLCDSEMQDQIAEFMATAPVLQRLDVLDLSMGILTDEGALALLTSPYIHHLKMLDVHHHFCSAPMIQKLEALKQNNGPQVDASEQQRPDGDWRFVAVSE